MGFGFRSINWGLGSESIYSLTISFVWFSFGEELKFRINQSNSPSEICYLFTAEIRSIFPFVVLLMLLETEKESATHEHRVITLMSIMLLVRTSLVESEGRSTPILRQPVVMDKDRDMVRACNGSSLPVEEKVSGLPTSGEGWDKKMKRKRSVGTVATRGMDGEREMKCPMHQKLPNDPRSQTYDANGFGSNPREDIQQAGSPSPVTKAKVSRGPRSGSTVTNSSPSFSRTPGDVDGWEQPSCLNKVQSMGGINNRKRPIPTGSSSPPMAQWVGQRQQKSSRTRRTNLVSPVSGHDEPQISSEGFTAPDFSSRLTVNEASGPLFSRVSTNNQHLKMKFENVPSPARLSESEESGAGENKIKEKGIDNDETVDRSVNTAPKVGSVMMPTKKNRMNVKDDIGDGVRRQGRSGRGSS